ncbi:MAG: ATP-binding cassette domain-containing protein, partial [Oscillospiraceae bacterium]|nr:ATP-binding cassette domain-containing protein [Oscillospiraceae bacterium]
VAAGEKADLYETVYFFTFLRKLDFSRALLERDMAGYSAGQKKKVLLAASLCQSAHLYIWDEPLNYIDLFSRIQMEELILQYRPTMVFVEHDRTFREHVATAAVELARWKMK